MWYLKRDTVGFYNLSLTLDCRSPGTPLSKLVERLSVCPWAARTISFSVSNREGEDGSFHC